MAKPRIFISSTYYDLKHVRADLERFIHERGYEPVLSERGSVPYGSEEKLEEYCYKEIELCDVLVAIVGGRYGTGSEHEPHSISQMELKTALDLGKPVYVFVDRNVWSEYSTYKANKDVDGIKYRFVDNVEVYKFLEEVEGLPRNNPIAPFETSRDITSYLQEQWAGLFQRLLQEQARLGEIRILEDMKSTARTLNQLVTFLTEERKKGDRAIRDILLSNHPAFEQLRKLLGVSYRVFFTNRQELDKWLKARGLEEVEEPSWDDEGVAEWMKGEGKSQELLKTLTSRSLCRTISRCKSTQGRLALTDTMQ